MFQYQIVERLDILLESGVIGKSVYDASVHAIDSFGEITDEQEFNMITAFIMHFAMSLQRAKDNEQIEIEQEVLNEVKGHVLYEDAKETLCKILNKFEYKVDKDERDLMLLHVLNILQYREDLK